MHERANTNGHAYIHTVSWGQRRALPGGTELTLEAAVLLAPCHQVRGKAGLAGEQLPNMWMAFNCSPKDTLGPAEEASVLAVRTRGCHPLGKRGASSRYGVGFVGYSKAAAKDPSPCRIRGSEAWGAKPRHGKGSEH